MKRKRASKALSLLLTLCMVLGLLPGMTLTASAAGTTEVSTWSDLQNAFNSGGEIQLTTDITAGNNDSALEVPSGKTVTLDLNGHTINRSLASPADDTYESANKKGNAIIVNGTLTVDDTSENKQGKITGAYSKREYFKCGAIYVASGGDFTLNAGSISGNKAGIEGQLGWHYGAGVSVDDGGTFTMNGGSISGNHSSWLGGGMASHSKATVNLLGGKIENNTASDTTSQYPASAHGGGVAAYGNVTIGGDIVIQNNTAKGTTNNLHFITWNIYLQLSADKPLETSAKIGWTGPPNSKVDAKGIKVAQGTNAKDYLDRFVSDQNSDYIFGLKAGEAETIYCAIANSTVVTKPVARNVTITAGQHMTKTQDSGNASQTVTASAITDVVYTADTGYYFPENYVSSINGLSSGTLNGITVTRDNASKITVSGIPTADTTITLGDAAEISEPTFNDGFGNANITSGSYKVDNEYAVGSGKYVFAGWYASADYSGGAVTEFTNGTTYYAKWTKNGKTVRTTALDLTKISQANTFGAVLQGSVYTNSAEGWTWDSDNNILTLANVTMDITLSEDTSDTAAVRLPDGAILATAPGTDNNVTVNNDRAGAIVGAGKLTIPAAETGKLTVVGGMSGICAKDIIINIPISVSAKVVAVYTEDKGTITIASGLEIKSPIGGKIVASQDASAIYEEDGTTPAKNVVIGIAKKYTVTYNANGGSTVDSATVSEGNKLTAPGAPTKDGYTFHGWYKDAAFTNSWNFDTDTVTGNTTLYAKWAETAKLYGISGTVYASDGTTTASGVSVKLMKGDKQDASATSDSNGAYSFTGVAPGVYNIVAEKDDTTQTTLVIVTNHNETGKNVTLPQSKVNSKLTVNGADTPDVVAGGLDKEAAAVKNDNSGATSVKVEMTVESKRSEAVAPADRMSIETSASGKTLEYLDIKVTKTVVDAASATTTTAITTTAIMMEIIIPYDMTGKNNITVYRYHDGVTKAFAENTTKADGTFYLDTANHLIYVYTQKFSTYAIGYNTQSGGGSGSGSGGSSSTNYPVTVPDSTPDGGKITVSPQNAPKGSTVTITVDPDDGYELDQLMVTDKNGNKIPVTAKGDGKYTFTMPAGEVTIEATFKSAEWNIGYVGCPKDNTCPIWPYTDAKTTDWYHDGVHFCLENGLMVGYGDNIFKPNAHTTRSMLIVMLWRLNGSPVVNYALDFADVKEGTWYTEAVRWAKSEGVAGGYGNGKFGPNDTLTREQMVTMLYRYAQYKGYDVSVGEDTNILSFGDATTVAEYAIPAMQWACGSGVVGGTAAADGSGLILDPKGSTTRAQMATMVMRFCAEIVK